MSRHTDVLIIGGGIIGLACAYYLMKAGKQVCIIEQDKIGSGASHGNCGLIFISHLTPLCAPGTITHEIIRFFKRTSPLYVKPGFDPGRLQWLLAFARKCNATHFAHVIRTRQEILHHSQRLYDTLFKAERLDGDLEKRGFCWCIRAKPNGRITPEPTPISNPTGLKPKRLSGMRSSNWKRLCARMYTVPGIIP